MFPTIRKGKVVHRFKFLEKLDFQKYYNREKLSPECIEEFIDYLVKNNRLDEAAKNLADIVNDDNFNSRQGKSKHQLWQELSELIAKHPEGNVKSELRNKNNL